MAVLKQVTVDGPKDIEMTHFIHIYIELIK